MRRFRMRRRLGAARRRALGLALPLAATITAIPGGSSTIRGRVLPGTSGRKVKVDVGGQTLATHTDSRGRFVEHWQAPSTGRFGVQVKAEGDRVAAGTSEDAGRITVFRHAV